MVLISKAPLFGILRAKLEMVSEAFFQERDFSQVKLLPMLLLSVFELDFVDFYRSFFDDVRARFFRFFEIEL